MYNADKIIKKDQKTRFCHLWINSYNSCDHDKHTEDYELRVTTIMGFWETRYLNGVRYDNIANLLKDCW